jgi:hypothetical protein
VRELLEAGADKDMGRHDAFTPLFCCSQLGHANIVKVTAHVHCPSSDHLESADVDPLQNMPCECAHPVYPALVLPSPDCVITAQELYTQLPSTLDTAGRRVPRTQLHFTCSRHWVWGAPAACTEPLFHWIPEPQQGNDDDRFGFLETAWKGSSY